VYGKRNRGEYANDTWLGTVVSVNIAKRVAQVWTHGAENKAVLATWSSTYCHPEGDREGVDVIPREGAQVILSRIQGLYIITGFVMPQTGAEKGGAQGGAVPDHAGFRPTTYQAGDFFIGSKAKNHIGVLFDGTIVMRSRALAQLVLDPLKNLGRFFLRNYELFVDGGFVKWWSKSSGGVGSSDYEAVIKDSPIEKQDNRVQVKIGREAGILNVEVMLRSGDSLIPTATMHVDPAGNVITTAAGNVVSTINGTTTIVAIQDVTVTTPASMKFVVGGNFQIECGGIFHVTAQDLFVGARGTSIFTGTDLLIIQSDLVVIN
jgi:hypothetical protein